MFLFLLTTQNSWGAIILDEDFGVHANHVIAPWHCSPALRVASFHLHFNSVSRPWPTWSIAKQKVPQHVWEAFARHCFCSWVRSISCSVSTWPVHPRLNNLFKVARHSHLSFDVTGARAWVSGQPECHWPSSSHPAKTFTDFTDSCATKGSAHVPY